MRLLELVESAELRRGDDGEPYVTDEGHYILDCAPRATGEMADLAAAVKAMPGVVEHGLFLTEADLALLGTPDGDGRAARALEAAVVDLGAPDAVAVAGRAREQPELRARSSARPSGRPRRAHPTRSVATVSAGVPSASAASVARARRATTSLDVFERHERPPAAGAALGRDEHVHARRHAAGRELAAAGHGHLDEPLAAAHGPPRSRRRHLRVAQHRRGHVGAGRGPCTASSSPGACCGALSASRGA